MSEFEESRPKWREWLTEFFSGESTGEASDFVKLLKAAAARDLVQEDAIGIIYGALHVSEMQARDIMIPRSRMRVIRSDSSAKQLLNDVVGATHSRFPVIGDDVNDVKGILHAKDILPWLQEEDGGERFDIKDLIRPAPSIPESKRLNILLKEFRSNRNHMAIVFDEYQNVSGLVTIEDVLEQIVGDIEDEHDFLDNEEQITEMNNGSFRIKADTSIEEFNERFKSNFENDDFDTVGGLVVSTLGHVPNPKEAVEINKFQFEVLSATNRRINSLLVQCLEDRNPS